MERNSGEGLTGRGAGKGSRLDSTAAVGTDSAQSVEVGEVQPGSLPLDRVVPIGSGGAESASDAVPEGREIPARLSLRRVGLALLIGVLLYVALLAAVESLGYRYGNRNPFFKVSTAQIDEPHLLIVGASRALPLVYDDMNTVVEEQLGVPVINLAMQGSGIVPNRLLVDYYLREHGADNARGVVYVLDSFAFNAPDWNEDRLSDTEVWQRAPLDPQLLASLWRATREMDVPASTFWNYLSGFSKLNDPPTWFEPDVWPDETNFDTAYSANTLQDQARISYLYPGDPEEQMRAKYEEQFRQMSLDLAERQVPLLVVSPPLRAEFLAAIPGEEAFKERLSGLLEDLGVPLHDFSEGEYEDAHFLDPDHLNREGAMRFLERDLVPVIDPLLEQ